MKELTEVLEDWEAVIGLEVHAELTTLKTKMFCSCPIEFGADPNTHTCPVCLGMPGALPVPNKAAIESIVLAGLATNCDIEKHTMFYRKGYFYPDMAKNFQTTQGPLAFCMRGHLDLELSAKGATERVDVPKDDDGGYTTRIGITRIHMEEDAGKMTHLGGSEGRIDGAERSLVDYNRAGTPLIELVTEPDLRTPEEARAFMQKLRQIYLTLGISDCSMEEGSLRADGNVSLRRRGSTELGTKTELKNINSFKNLHDGLAYEICRQAEVLESGGVIRQETRHWEPGAKRTIVMRVKETADDYRMFPDPDLAPFDLSDEFIENVRAKLPELPDAKKAGLLYCSAEANSQYQVDEVQKYLEDKGLTVTQYAFSDSNDLASVCQKAADENDVLYVPTDNTVAANTGIVDGICRPAKKPVFAGEEGICAGCGVATLSISYYDLGYTTGEMAVKVLKGEADISTMPIEYTTVTKKYNKAICEDLGLTVPDGYEEIEG